MNRILIATFVAAAVTASVAFDARASIQQAGEQTTQPWIEVINLPTVPEASKPVRKSRLADRKDGDLPVTYQFDVSHVTAPSAQRDNCLRNTGSRLRRADRDEGRHCSGGPGQVYVREDLDADGNTKGRRR